MPFQDLTRFIEIVPELSIRWRNTAQPSPQRPTVGLDSCSLHHVLSVVPCTSNNLRPLGLLPCTTAYIEIVNYNFDLYCSEVVAFCHKKLVAHREQSWIAMKFVRLQNIAFDNAHLLSAHLCWHAYTALSATVSDVRRYVCWVHMPL